MEIISKKEATQPILLPSQSEFIWEKFVYFDEKANEYPNNFNYRDKRDELLEMWLEQFKKEINNVIKH